MSHNRARTTLTQAHDARWRRLPLETLFAIWHLQRGGLTFSEVADRLGIDGRTVGDAAAAVDAMITGPLPVPKNVRCRECGSLLTHIPCRSCGWKTEKFRVPRETTVDLRN